MPSPSDLYAQWRDKQRPQCLRCAHLDGTEMPGGNLVMRCRATPREFHASHRPGNHYCIDARDAGQPCGPSAALFKEKK